VNGNFLDIPSISDAISAAPTEVCSVHISRPETNVDDGSVHDPKQPSATPFIATPFIPSKFAASRLPFRACIGRFRIWLRKWPSCGYSLAIYRLSSGVKSCSITAQPKLLSSAESVSQSYRETRVSAVRAVEGARSALERVFMPAPPSQGARACAQHPSGSRKACHCF
jgi:hypothetical protein